MNSRYAWRLAAVLAVLTWGMGAIAAEIEGVRLERDPSSESALRLTVEVIFPPGQGDSTLGLQVRAYSAPAPQGDRSQPLRARGREHRDDSGLYQLVGEARRGDGPRGEVAFRVDARELDLPPGQSRVGLLVLGGGRQEDRSLAAAPAALIEVQARPYGTAPGVRVTSIDEPPAAPPASVATPAPAPADSIFAGSPTIPAKAPVVLRAPSKSLPSPEAPAKLAPGGGGLGASIELGPAPSVTETAESPDRFGEDLRTRPHIPLDKAQTDARKRTLYFATNRAQVPGGDTLNERFSNDLAPANALTFGSVEVNIPVWIDGRYRPPGELTLPGLWNLWKADDPRVFHAGEPVNLTWDQVRQRLQPQLGGQEDDILVLVHGFNNTMEYAALRLAQLANDTGYLGRAVLFSWPSAGSLTFYWERMTWTPRVVWAYSRDSEMAERSGEPLADLLARLIAVQHARAVPVRPVPRVHVLAHSMGNRVLLLALNNLRERPEIRALSGVRKPLGHIVLAAADVDYNTFTARGDVVSLADDVTIYYCRDDVALALSRVGNLDSRVGAQGFWSRVHPMMENVDSILANTSILGHDYFVTGNRLLVDLRLLLRENLRAARRGATIRPMRRPDGYDYWAFR